MADYQYIDPLRLTVKRLDTGDCFLVSNQADSRVIELKAWIAAGNEINAPPDTSAIENIRQSARAALRNIDWQAELDTINAGRNVVAQIAADTNVPAATRQRIAAVMGGLIDNAEKNGRWWKALLEALGGL